MSAVVATCSDCGHQWTLATFTGSALTPIRIEGTRCPRCHSPSHHVANAPKEVTRG